MTADIASFMRELAEARARNRIDREPLKALIERIAAVCPRVICPGCHGTLGGCRVCFDRGVVCPVCTNAGWLRVETSGQTPAAMVPCKVCRSPTNEGWQDDDTRRTFAIEQALYAAGAHIEPISLIPLADQADAIFGDTLVAAAPARWPTVNLLDDDDWEGMP